MASRKSAVRAGLITGAALVLALGGVGVAVASSDDDAADKPITGSALQRAERAALAETGGGTVTATEVGDEQSYYEIEVTLDDGRTVDVQLDRSFQVAGSESDSEADDS